MIFTPDERRALFALASLLFLGQVAASVQRWREAKPDREVSAWLERWSAAAESTRLAPVVIDSFATEATASAEPLLGSPVHRPVVPVRPREEAPPGILEHGRLRINEATTEQLEALPGVGPALAQRIAEARAEGPFLQPEDLRRVKGIGPAKLAKIAPYVDWGL